jgi:hypothetical protein
MTALVLAIALLAQTPAPLPSLVPPDIDLEKYLPPPAPPVECSPAMLTYGVVKNPMADDFVIKYMDADKKPQTWTLRPGYAISECELVKIINTRVERDRLDLELSSLKNLRSKEFQLWRIGEGQYQTRIRDLEGKLQEAEKKSFWDEWKGEFGFGFGVVATVALVIGTAEVLKAVK